MNDQYRELTRELWKESDKVYGITSEFREPLEIEEKSVITAYNPPVFQRNAYGGEFQPLQERQIEPDRHPTLIKNNTLFKALTTFRGVRHVLQYCKAATELSRLEDQFKDFQEAIKGIFEQNGGDKGNPEQLQKLLDEERENFNLRLLYALKGAGLLADIESDPEAWEKLLNYCRYLAGLLDPTPVVKTITALPNINGEEYYQAETSYPITKKTPAQIKALEEAIPKTADQSLVTEQSFYTAMPHYLQTVTRAFRPQLLDHNTVLGPQLRKFIPHTVKHGFVVKNDILKLKSETDLDRKSSQPSFEIYEPGKSMWSSRSGTLVYVGKGETKAAMRGSVNENLAQIKENAATIVQSVGDLNVSLHVMTLNTEVDDSAKQGHMVKMTRNAATQTNNSFSNVATNFEGIVHKQEIAPQCAGYEKLIPSGLPKNSSIIIAAAAGLQVSFNHKTLDVVITHCTCASGVDRTGTNQFLKTVIWLYQRLAGNVEEKDREKLLKDIIAQVAAGGHSVVMAHITCPSSPGMKPTSKPRKPWRFFKDLFDSRVNKNLYLESAGANKKTLTTTLKQIKKQIQRRTGMVGSLLVIGVDLPIILKWAEFSAAMMSSTIAAINLTILFLLPLALLVVLGYRRGYKRSTVAVAIVCLILLPVLTTLAGSIKFDSANALFSSMWQGWLSKTSLISGFAVGWIAIATVAVVLAIGKYRISTQQYASTGKELQKKMDKLGAQTYHVSSGKMYVGPRDYLSDIKRTSNNRLSDRPKERKSNSWCPKLFSSCFGSPNEGSEEQPLLTEDIQNDINGGISLDDLAKHDSV